MKFTIQGRLAGLNEYTKMNRTKSVLANIMKREQEEIISYYIKQHRLKPVTEYPVKLRIAWYEKDNKRDIDNVIFAKKFILDALVKTGILQNDTRQCVCGFEEVIETDKHNPRIEVELVKG